MQQEFEGNLTNPCEKETARLATQPAVGCIWSQLCKLISGGICGSEVRTDLYGAAGGRGFTPRATTLGQKLSTA